MDVKELPIIIWERLGRDFGCNGRCLIDWIKSVVPILGSISASLDVDTCRRNALHLS